MPEAKQLPKAYQLAPNQRRTARAESLPRNVFVEVTSRCNYACTTCPHTYRQDEPHRDMTLAEFERIIDQFPDMERAVLHGIGEPLLNTALPEMIALCHARGVHTLFNSNGALLTADRAEALIQSGLDEYRLSLSSSTSEGYRRIHGTDHLQQVLKNLRGLVHLQAEYGIDLPRISIWCIGMKWNLAEIPEMIRLAAEIGVPEVYLQRMTYDVDPSRRQGIAQPEQALFGNLQQQEQAVIDECNALAAELGIAFRASGATDAQHSLAAAREEIQQPARACLRPWTTAYISANGNALPCCIAPFSDADYQASIMGNVWNEPFESIWNNERYQAWRRTLLSPHPPQACRGCGVYWSL